MCGAVVPESGGACTSIRVYTRGVRAVFSVLVRLRQPVGVLAKGRDQGERLDDVTARVEEDLSQVWGRSW